VANEADPAADGADGWVRRQLDSTGCSFDG
jgi:hypothetical protein